MRIQITVPGLLASCIGEKRSAWLDAATLADALEQMKRLFPLLTPHIYDDAGNIRRHVLVYLNDESVAWIEDHSLPLKEGDRIQIIQAVSGGSPLRARTED